MLYMPIRKEVLSVMSGSLPVFECKINNNIKTLTSMTSICLGRSVGKHKRMHKLKKVYHLNVYQANKTGMPFSNVDKNA